MKKYTIKNFCSSLLCMLFVFFAITPACFAAKENKADAQTKINSAISKAIAYEKSLSDGYIINNDILENMFDFSDAKLVISLSQGGFSDNFNNYSAVLNNFISDKYRTNEKLYSLPVSSGAQMSLALLACGINPYTLTGENGKTYDFIAENIFNRDAAYSLGKGGIEGYAWGLIALDAYNYDFDVDILKIREDIMSKIVDSQLPDGSYASTNSTSPYYLSALSVLALANDYNNEKRKNEIKNETIRLKKEIDKQRKEEGLKVTFEEYEKEYGMEEQLTLYHYIDMCVDKSLALLSEKQSKNGAYTDYEKSNIQTTSAVITALCTLGIDPEKDERFIKDGKTLIDGLLEYQSSDGSFKYIDSTNPKNETIDALAALIAYRRFLENKTPLYDFSEKNMQYASDMLQPSKTDINNIRYINENFNLSLYPQVCMIYEKVQKSQRKDKILLLSVIETIKEKKAQHESIIKYINDKGSELLYSEKGVNLTKKRQIRELLRLCEALPEKEHKHIYIYPDLIANSKRVENALALETLLFSLVLIVIASFFLSILMFFIKKQALASKMMIYSRIPHQQNGEATESRSTTDKKDKSMPFEADDSFFDYYSEDNDVLVEEENKELPFENNTAFFDYEMPAEEQYENDTSESFKLPFEDSEDDFFSYDIEGTNGVESEKPNEDDMLPFEKDDSFFKYK